MGDSDTSLLFKIRGDASGAKHATAETRAAVASLRSQLGGEFNAMQSAGQSALANLGNSVNVFVGQRLPLIGGGFLRVTENIKGFGDASTKGAAQLANLNKTIDGLAASTGKSRGAITSFLTQFVQLETQAKRDAAAIQTFGAGIAQTLIPQLEKAGTEMATVAATTEGVGASMAAVAGPIGIALIAVAALTVGAVALTKEFLSLVHATAEWQGKLFDLSQQTGVSVETLNALEIAAGKTGGSIESISQALVIYQGKLEEAQDASSETGKKFAELKISTDNTEDSLRSAFEALAKMPEGFHQTNEAAELFGRRGGKQVLAIIKETNGDIDSAVTKLGALARVTTEEARAADEFNDALKDVSTSMRGLTALVVRDSIPQILSALKAVSQLATKVLSENKEAISAISTAIGVFVRGNLVILLGGLNSIQLALNGVNNTWLGVKSLLLAGITGNISITMDIFQRFKGQQEALAGLRAADAGIQGNDPFGGLAGGFSQPAKGGGGGKKARNTELQDALKEAELAAKEIRLRIDTDIAENKRSFDREARDIEEFTRRATELADQRLNVIIDRVNAEQQVLDRSFAKKLISQKAYDIKTRELSIDTQQAVQENEEELSKLEDDRDKQIAAARLAATQRRIQMQEDADAAIIASIEDRVSQEKLLLSEAEKQIAVIAQEAFARRRQALLEELEAYGLGAERRKAINDELIRLEGERANAVDKASRRIRDALKSETRQRAVEKENQARLQGIDLARGDEGRERQALTPDFTGLSEFEKLQQLINRNFEEGSSKAIGYSAALDAMQVVVGGLGQALGNVLHSFILFGSAGTSFRKFAAEVIASVAQMAVVKAVFELAEGFAALARAFFGDPRAAAEATMHFKSAAIYGTIAGVAAVIGRGVAGDSFNKQSSGGGSGGGGSRGNSTSSSGEIPTRDVNRNALATQTITRELVFKVKGDALVNTFVEDYNLNGRTRIIIKSDGQG